MQRNCRYSKAAYSPIYLTFYLVISCSSEKDAKLRNASYFYEELHAFGLYYTPEELVDYERVLRFQGFLDRQDTEPDELFYNTHKHMRRLTPNCSDIFVSCQLAGQPIGCLDQFQDSLTSNGFCCTFNMHGK